MNIKILIALLGLLCLEDPGRGDQFHYSNILLGDRAMGMAGAFTAVADDASGMFYNPAGLAFALSNDISGSANAFYKKTSTYKKTIGDNDFVEESAGSTAPFFGGLQKVDSMIPGVAFAFGLYNRDSELKNQDTNLSEESLGIERFHRAANIRASTAGYGFALAKRMLDSLSMGVSVTLLQVDELVQEYQDAQQFNNTSYFILTQNIRQHLQASALEIGVGAQWALTPKMSIGVNIKIPTILTQSFESDIEQTVATRDQSSEAYTLERTVADDQKYDNPLGSWPSEYRFGYAWFVSTSLLWTIDVVNFSAAKGDLSLFERNSVTNYATGVEYYITPPLPIRFGYFTNNDARPEIDPAKTDQQDHIDYTGVSLFLAWVQPNSQISIGGILQQGTGQAQKIAGSTTVQDVEAQLVTIALSATHNF